MKKILQKLGNNLAYIIVGIILVIGAGVAYAYPVSVPNSPSKGAYLSGLTTGNYQTNTACSNGQILAASSTTSSGWACVVNTAATGATTTIITNVTTNGPNFTFSTSTNGSGLLNITGSGSTINFNLDTTAFPTFTYASSTFQLQGSYVTNTYASTTFPSFVYASSTYVNLPYASSTFVNYNYSSSTFPSFSYASSTFPGFNYASSTFVNYAYGTSTYATIGNYPTYGYASSTFPSFTYASSTFNSFGYSSSTFPTFSYGTSTYATIANYPTYTYASNTFATILNYPTYSYGSSTYVSYGYASSTFPSFSYASNTFQTTLTFPLTVSQGGTGSASITPSDILFGNYNSPIATSSLLTYTTAVGFTAPTSTLATTSVTQLTNSSVKSALVLNNGSGLEGAYGGSSSCASSTAVTILSASGVATCASNGLFPSSSVSGTINQVAYYGGTNTFAGSGNFTWDTKTLVITGSATISSLLNVTGTSTLATTTVTALTMSQAPTISAFSGTQCLHETSGVVGVTGSDCGSGGGYTSTAGQNIYLTATSSSAGTFNAIPFSTFTVNNTAPIAGTNYHTIQAALTACGTNGGGTIVLTDPLYAQATTGLTFSGNDCVVTGSSASTTITFTGATTLFKTGNAAALYSGNGIKNLTITADGNASGVVLDASNMSHGTYDNIIADSVGTGIKLNDTQNITFYNEFSNWDITTIKSFGINASSTNSVNENLFTNIFTGCGSSGCYGLYMNNGNNNKFYGFRAEPGTKAGRIGIRLTDTAASNGVFDNQFYGSYVEANDVGISISGTNGSTGGIIRNQFYGGIIDSDNTDISASSTTGYLQTFVGVDNNFGTQLTSLQGPVGVDNLSAKALMDIQDPSFGNTGLSVKDNASFAETANNLVQFTLFNGSDSSNLLNLSNAGTGYTLVATTTTNNVYIAANGRLSVNSTTPASDLSVQGYSGQIIPLFEVASSSKASDFVILANGNVGIGTTTASGFFTIQGAQTFNSDLLDVYASSTLVMSVASSTLTNIIIGSSTEASNLSILDVLSSTATTTEPLFRVASTTGGTYFTINANGQEWTGGSSPTCGTGCSSVTGDDSTMRVVTGSSVTAVTVNFNPSWTNPVTGVLVSPACSGSDESGGTTTSDPSTTPTSVTINLSASLTTKNLTIQCKASVNFTQ